MDAASRDEAPPGWARWLLRMLELVVVGCTWPAGDAGAMDEQAARLDLFATAVRATERTVAHRALEVTTENSGQAVEAFGTATGQLGRGLLELAAGAEALAAHCRVLADEIRAAKAQFLLSLGILVAVWAAAHGLAVFTAGGSEAAALAETVAVGLALRRILAAALTRVVSSAQALQRAPLLQQTLAGTAYSGGQNLASQVTRQHYGVQCGFDAKALALAAGTGAVGGAAIGGAQLSLGVLRANPNATVSTVATTLSDHSAGRVAVGASAAFTTGVATQAALYGGQVDWVDTAVNSVGSAAYGQMFPGAGVLGRPEAFSLPKGWPGEPIAMPRHLVDLHTPEMTARFEQASIYRKHVVVQVEFAVGGEQIRTVLKDGTVETENVANPGDAIISVPDGERYILPAERFPTLYEHVAGDQYLSTGTVRAFRSPVEEYVTILAPWGREQYGAPPEVWFATPYYPDRPELITQDRYLIGTQVFRDTFVPYQPPSGGPPPESR